MKKIVFFVAVIAFSFCAQAQDYTKFQMNRAAMFSTYIAEKMELNETQQQFVYDVMLARIYNSNATIKSQNLTAQADKQVVYKSEYKNAQEKLAAEFGAKDARKMMNLSNEARKNAENK
tara:strand:- start:18 stop:374 length:357 start_codon:yes stop_codon:yes gene_type:complete